MRIINCHLQRRVSKKRHDIHRMHIRCPKPSGECVAEIMKPERWAVRLAGRLAGTLAAISLALLLRGSGGVVIGGTLDPIGSAGGRGGDGSRVAIRDSASRGSVGAAGYALFTW